MSHRALERLLGVAPQIVGVRSGVEALGLRPHELLHAGPPLRDPRNPPPVLMSSAVMAALYEGWAADAGEAEAGVRSGALRLGPAQERGGVTPLAAVITANTPLFEIGDGAASSDGGRVWAPVSAVRGIDTRMGGRDPGLLPRLNLRDTVIAPAWREALARHGPLPLWPLAGHGLAQGDDLHSRTAAANQALANWLRPRAPAEASDAIEATPLFFLTIWMAACRLILQAAEGGDLPSLVTRAGGNGEVFGISLAGAPWDWATTPAAAPNGPRLPGMPAEAAVCGAIGDSAVIDMLGFGGLRLALAPEPLQAFGAHLPADQAGLAHRLLAMPHPRLDPAWPVGLDARRVVSEDAAPLVALAMIGADGQSGFLGRGLYRPPVALFARALAVLP